uniref:Uncharacterized protein n=1 Tax=Anguilla anguilla TaxID=7936 RepID=A0A0E9S6J3_ANGAN
MTFVPCTPICFCCLRATRCHKGINTGYKKERLVSQEDIFRIIN